MLAGVTELLHIVHEEKRAINQGWKAQPGCNQQVKPHALPLALLWIGQALNRVRKLAGNGSDRALTRFDQR
jgi:hypothetical protein